YSKSRSRITRNGFFLVSFISFRKLLFITKPDHGIIFVPFSFGVSHCLLLGFGIKCLGFNPLVSLKLPPIFMANQNVIIGVIYFSYLNQSFFERRKTAIVYFLISCKLIEVLGMHIAETRHHF